MKIRIVKKSGQVAKGKCPACSSWRPQFTLEVMRKRGLAKCSVHGCYTPDDGSCTRFSWAVDDKSDRS